MPLDQDAIDRVKSYLAQGDNHICHSDRSNKSICRGGREYQLELLYKRGFIDSPTDESLAESMRKIGIKPSPHIRG